MATILFRQTHYQNMAQNLKRTLVFNNGIMPLGLGDACDVDLIDYH